MNFEKLFFTILGVFCYANALFSIPEITSVSPSNGSAIGGNTVIIIGSGFTGISGVNFGNKSATFTFISDTTINAVVPSGSPGTVNVTINAGSQTSLITNADYYTYQGDWLAVVSNAFLPGSAFVIDITNPSHTTTTFSLSGNFPVANAISPDGKTAYVVNLNDNSIAKIDLTTHPPTLSSTISSPNFDGPNGISISPDGKFACLVNTNTNAFVKIDLTTPIPTEIVVTSPNFTSLFLSAITPDGRMALVSNTFDDSVVPVDLTTPIPTPGAKILGFNGPSAIAITPDGTKALVTNFVPGDVVPIDLTVTPPVAGTPIVLSGANAGIAITPDGRTAYVITTNSVTPLNLTTPTPTIEAPILGITNPVNIAISPDGRTAYVTVQANAIVPIDIAQTPPHVGASIPLSASPSFISITPDQAPVARFNTTIGSGDMVLFDASGSLSPVGTIASYAWDFGDGSTEVTTSPTITHTYINGGSPIVTLTVTNSNGTSTRQTFTGQTVSNEGGPTATVSNTINTIMPPANIQGHQIANKFLTQTDLINVITWSKPDGIVAPVLYKIFRDSSLTDLVAVISANAKLIFEDHNRKKNKTYTYFIISVNAAGLTSFPAQVTVKSKRK